MPTDARHTLDDWCDQFEAEWSRGNADLAVFLSSISANELADAECSREELLSELVKIDLEHQWRRANETRKRIGDGTEDTDDGSLLGTVPSPPTLDAYLRKYPELRRDVGVSTNLIAEEYRVRWRWGDRPNHDAFLRQFGKRGESLRGLLDAIDLQLAEIAPTSQQTTLTCPACRAEIACSVNELSAIVTCPNCGQTVNLVSDPVSKGVAQAASSTLAQFELIEEVGRGTFGVVWKARDTKLDRIVAVKVARQSQLAGGSAQVFLREARAAAQLSHPNIVRVYEAGEQDGTVYLVCDFIEGVTLDDWMTENHPDYPKTAQLVVKVANALEHAHQAGVIHRDLKPGNIMMDANDEPHIMDFGLARRESGEVTMTLEGHVLGTPAYMSPEQARGEGHQADRRTDIYSLGVILYELCTGVRPFQGNVRMLLKQVAEDEPPSPAKFVDRLPKDLETICMACLEKDPTRRYELARNCEADLKRFLNNEPILARPHTQLYRARKWAQKNRGVVIPCAAIAVLLIGGTAISSRFAFRASQEARRAQRAEQVATTSANRSRDILRLVTESFQQVDPYAGADAKMSAKDVLKKAMQNLESSELDDEGKLGLLSTLNVCLKRLGEYDLALSAATQFHSLARQLLGPEHPDTVYARGDLASALLHVGKFQEALPLLEATFDHQKMALGERDPETLATMNDLALAHKNAGQFEVALNLLEQRLALQEEYFGEADQGTIVAIQNLAKAYLEAGRSGEGLALSERSVSLCRDHFKANHPFTLNSLHNLANALKSSHRFGESISLFREVLEARKQTLGPDHPDTLQSMNDLAHALRAAGKYDESIPLFRATLAAAKQILGPDHPNTLMAKYNLARALWSVDRWHEAVPLFEVVLEERKAKLGPDHPVTLHTTRRLAQALDRAGRSKEALPFFKQVLSQLPSHEQGVTPNSVGPLRDFARALVGAGDLSEAEVVLNRCIAFWESRGAETWHLFDLMSLLGEIMLLRGNKEAAERFLHEAHEGLKQHSQSIPASDRMLLLKDANNRLASLARSQDHRDSKSSSNAERSEP